jgi:hypothetical protein
LGAEPDLDLGYNHLGQRSALAPSPNAVAGGRNGGFTLLTSSEPVVEMAGFEWHLTFRWWSSFSVCTRNPLVYGQQASEIHAISFIYHKRVYVW